jgi:NAD+ synthase
MELTQDVFAIQCDEICAKIEAFLREKTTELRRDGIVVPISGGLDSSVVVSLCVRAAGKDHVIGLMLPEKKGNPDALAFATKLTGQLGINTTTIDISPILSAIGTYQFISNKIGPRGFVKTIVQGFMPGTIKALFLDGIKGTKNRLVREGMASIYTKHRIRMVVTYKFAEERNLLVAGCAHKSEDLLGLFTKFGIDDNADVMPLKNLYRSHILQIAHYIGVPNEIIERKPNPDVLPGIEDKYFDVLGIPANTADLILYGLEHAFPCEEIANQLKIDAEKVQEIKELVQSTAHMRNPSLSPEL